MKNIFQILIILFAVNNTYAQITFNGLLDSTVSMTANADDFSLGIEEFANIRFQSRLRENRAVVYGAVNLIAVAGDYALNAIAMSGGQTINYIDHEGEEQEVFIPAGFSSYVTGENYIAAIELERLYFRLNFEKADFDGGLFRLPFGYSQVWGSSDFLNPRNPLKPDARPRGVLGAAVNVFPAGDLKLTGFAVTPRDPLQNDGSGVLAGLSAENHWGRASVQALYSYETPIEEGSQYGIHRSGFSLKADAVVSFTVDTLYTYNHEAKTEWDGLSLSAGADYSFFDGKLIVLAEYLFNGENSSTAFSETNLLGMSNRHYLYSGFTWLFNDFTNAGIALISCLDETEFTPILTFNHDLFQGASLMIMAQAPLNDDVFDNGNYIFNFSARLRLRF